MKTLEILSDLKILKMDAMVKWNFSKIKVLRSILYIVPFSRKLIMF